MTKIIQPSLIKRTLVAVADFALFLFVVLGIFAAGQAIATSSLLGTSLKASINGYQFDSGLYYADEDGNAKPYDNLANYADYETKLVRFYTVYLRLECPEAYRTDYDVYWYNVHVLGMEDVKGQYASDVIAEPAKDKGPVFFEYGSGGADVLAEPKASLHIDGDKAKPLSPQGKAALLEFYYSPSSPNAYQNAGKTLYYSAFYQQDLQQYQRITSVIPVAAGVGISGLIFYFILPLILKDGSTICKRAFGLGVISAGGYKAKKAQFILRQAPTILAGTLLFLFVDFPYAVMVASLSLLLSYVLSLVTKKRQALHDFVGYTMVVDAKESFFYKNAAEEEATGRAFDEAMEEAERIKQEGEDILHQEALERSKKD